MGNICQHKVPLDSDNPCVECAKEHTKLHDYKPYACYTDDEYAKKQNPVSSTQRLSFSQAEIVSAARHWIKTHYQDSDPDTRMARLGLLIDFVTDLVPNEPSC